MDRKPPFGNFKPNSHVVRLAKMSCRYTVNDSNFAVI